MKEPANQGLIKRRRETIEPTFGMIKETIGFRHFHLRGLENADTEWRLVTLACNVRRLNLDLRWRQYLVGRARGRACSTHEMPFRLN